MKRLDLYETIEEADDAFKQFCDSHTNCNGCPFKERRIECQIAWLYQEVGLKPCPFCGNDGIDREDYNGFKIKQVKEEFGGLFYRVFCSCMAYGPAAESIEEAIEEWNKRAKAPKVEVTE